jgi:Flp pilus assembly pilin Flp
MISLIQAFRASRGGASAAEYALIAGIICIAIIAGGTAVGTAVNDRLSTAATLVSAK